VLVKSRSVLSYMLEVTLFLVVVGRALVSPVGGPHSLMGVVGTAVMRNCRKTGVYNVQQ